MRQREIGKYGSEKMQKAAPLLAQLPLPLAETTEKKNNYRALEEVSII